MKRLFKASAVLGAWFVGFRAGIRAINGTRRATRLGALKQLRPGANFNLLND